MVDKPEIGSGAEALCLVGWGLANGSAAVPELLTIDGVVYERLAHVSLDRSDVVRHFDVSAEVKSGFALLVQKSPGQRPLRRRGLLRKNGVTVAGTSKDKIRIVKPAAGFTGFIDDIFRYHICEISHPSNDVNRQLSVKTSRPSVVFASMGGDVYRPMSLAPKTLSRVKGLHGDKILLAMPDDGETEVWVQ